MNLKNKLKSIFIKTFIWKILQNLKIRYLYYFSKNFTQYDYHEKLLKYLNFKNGFFIELGASDGVRFSNTLYLEKFLNWKGILIEPSKKFKNLKKFRNKKNYFYNLACCSFENKNDFEEYIFADLSTFPKKKYKDEVSLKKYINYLNPNVTDEPYTFKSRIKTLNEILLETNSPKIIDFLSLDVEGEEIEVLKGIDFNLFSFNFILIEGVDKEMLEFMYSKKYKILEDFRYDTLFKKFD